MCLCARHEVVHLQGIGDLQKGRAVCPDLRSTRAILTSFQVLQYRLCHAVGLLQSFMN